jgi:hypothetical protein
LPAQNFFFSLAPGAPRGARIHPQTGIFSWTPGRDYGLSTNRMIVRVTDDGIPSLTSTQLLTVVVGDFTELLLGRGIVRAGETGSVPVRVRTTIPLTNVSFTFRSTDSTRLGSFALSAATAPIGNSTLQALPNNEFQVRLEAVAGQRIANDGVVSELRFVATGGATSGFVPISVLNVSAVQFNGIPAPRALGSDGRVVYLNAQPLLELPVATRPEADLYLYTRAPGNYTIQSAATLDAPIAWSILKVQPTTNLMEVLTISSTNRAQYLRVMSP